VKTYPILRKDGSLHAFEITSAWLTYAPLLNCLRSIEGVSDVRRKWFSDDRITFAFRGKPAVVHEAWGDSSRYWIGFKEPDISSEIDLTPLHDAFKVYRVIRGILLGDDDSAP
jgi:hypothetical protein